jgi:predicted ATP-grasp superfamily ATP-dependent carboligase
MHFGLDIDLRHLRAERPPVLLLGGLPLLRPLGEAGIPVIVGSPYRDDPTFVSRHCTGRMLHPPLAAEDGVAEALLAAGDRLLERFGRRVPLFYGNDDYLNLIYTHREALAQRFLLLLNDREVGDALIDKDRFEAFARSRNLRVPRTLAWDGTGRDALENATGPVLVKPKVKVGWEDSQVYLRLIGSQGKARVFQNGRQVMDHPLARQLKDLLTFQEYVPGSDRQLWSFHGFADENANLLAWFVGQKLRTFPSLTGMSTYLELAHDDELAALGRDITGRVPLKGVFKVDFKRDPGSGRFYMLEINARFNLWHYPAARNGVNLPQVAYDYLVNGTRAAPQPYRTSIRWLCFSLDYRAYRDLASRGELDWPGWIASIVGSRKVYDLFSWTDPVPALRHGCERLLSWSRRSLGHLKIRLRQWLSTAS